MFNHRFLLFFCWMIIGTLFISASRHQNTSANPQTSIIEIPLKDEILKVTLDGPGVTVRKFSNGMIQFIEMQTVDALYQIHFHPCRKQCIEQPEVIKRFASFEGQLLLDGQQLQFDQFANILYEGNYSQGKPHGPYRIFNEYSSLVEERFYERGFPIGTWSLFNVSGIAIATIEFPSSAKNWEDTTPYPNRPINKKRDTLYSMPVKKSLTVKETWYDSSGNKQKEKIHKVFQQGKSFFVLDAGQSISWNPNGTKWQEKNLSQGRGEVSTFFQQEGKWYRHTELWINGQEVNSTIHRLER